MGFEHHNNLSRGLRHDPVPCVLRSEAIHADMLQRRRMSVTGQMSVLQQPAHDRKIALLEAGGSGLKVGVLLRCFCDA